MTSWMQDVRFGVRMLTKTPGLTAVILITLALGMGFYGSTFSLAHHPRSFPDGVRVSCLSKERRCFLVNASPERGAFLQVIDRQ